MKKRIALSFFVFHFFMQLSHAQIIKSWEVDFGADIIAASLSNRDHNIRPQSYGDGVYENGYSDIRPILYHLYSGFKIEIVPCNEKLKFTTGLRFTSLRSDIKAKGEFLYDNYFFFLIKRETTTTEYLMTRKINQNSLYIGIPLEAKYYFGKPKTVRFFVKLGFEFDFKVDTKTHIEFVNPAMSIYEKEAVARLEEPGSFASLMQMSGGMRIGKAFKPSISFELNAPAIFLTSGQMGMIIPQAGAGVQITFQMPFKYLNDE